VGEREGVEGLAAASTAAQTGRAFQHDGEARVEGGGRLSGEERQRRQEGGED
jgi:hypothetical protein